MNRVLLAFAGGMILLAGMVGCSASLPTNSQIEAASPEGLRGLRDKLDARLQSDPEDPELLFLSATVSFRAGELETAEARALRAAAQWRFDAPLTELLGRIYLAQNKRFRALTAFSQAIQFDPEQLSAYVNLAITHQLLQQPRPAREALQGAIGREPRYFPAQYQLARVFFQNGEMERAADTVLLARGIRPDDLNARLLEVRIAKGRGQLTIAIFLAREALEIHPGALQAQREVLDVQVQRQEWESAAEMVREMEQAGGLAPEDAVVKAHLLRMLGSADKAQALLDDLAGRHPGHPQVLLAQGQSLLLRSDPKGAARVLERALERAPRSASAQYWTALAHYRLGNVNRANVALNLAVGLAPGDPRIRLLQARRFLTERKLGLAAPLLAQHLAEFPADGNALLINAELLTLQGNYPAAERHLNELAPGESESALRFARARLAYLRSAFLAVLEQTSPMVKRADAPWQMAYLHASALGRLGRYKEASGMLRARMAGTESGGAFHRLAGELQRLAGRPAEAARIFEEGLGQFPRNADLLERATHLAIEQGQAKKALPWLETAVELRGPWYPQFLERLAMVYGKLGKAAKSHAAMKAYLALTDPLLGERRHATEHGILFGTAFPAIGYSLRSSAKRP